LRGGPTNKKQQQPRAFTWGEKGGGKKEMEFGGETSWRRTYKKKRRVVEKKKTPTNKVKIAENLQQARKRNWCRWKSGSTKRLGL